MADISRRQFLRGDFRGRLAAPLRPPWARAEPAFRAACTRCAECIGACPQHIIAADQERRPVVDFSRGECTFCGKCVEVCAPRALDQIGGEPPWRLKARIRNDCLARQNVVCRSCGDACPAQAIRFRPQPMAAALPEVDEAGCTGCGACFAPCPAKAISLA